MSAPWFRVARVRIVTARTRPGVPNLDVRNMKTKCPLPCRKAVAAGGSGTAVGRVAIEAGLQPDRRIAAQRTHARTGRLAVSLSDASDGANRPGAGQCAADAAALESSPVPRSGFVIQINAISAIKMAAEM